MTDPTKLDFVSLQVTNLKKSEEFYTKVLGFESGQSPNSDAVVFKDVGGAIFAVRKPLTDLSSVSKVGLGISLWFAVSNIDELHKQILKSGAKIVDPPSDSPFGKKIIVSDPDGYQITLHEYQR